MPRRCITKYFLESLEKQNTAKNLIHFYDEELQGFVLEYRGKKRGTWYFRYRAKDGKNKFYRIGALRNLSLFEARERAYALYHLVQDGVDIKNMKRGIQSSLTLEKFAQDIYLPQARLKKRSWELDQRILRLHILPRFGHCQMDAIQDVHIMTWQGELRSGGLAPGTCNRTFVLLKTIFNCALRWGYLSDHKNPCCNVSTFEDSTLKERYLTPREARRLVEALSTCRRESARAILLLLYTGARKNEILSARWEHVDLERRLLTVPLSKSGKTRHIPLSDDAVRIFRSIPRCTVSPWVFPGTGKGGHLQSVFKLWRSIRIRLGLKDVRLHDLRHSFASFLVNAGCSLYEVQRCLGHYDPKVTMRYAHLAPKALVQAANMVGKWLESPETEK